MLQYLSRVDVQTNNTVRLGILTNGTVWRLYFQGALSVSEDFLEIYLAKALQLPGHELNLIERVDDRLTPYRALRLFILFFGKAAFLPAEGVRALTGRPTSTRYCKASLSVLTEISLGHLKPRTIAARFDSGPGDLCGEHASSIVPRLAKGRPPFGEPA
jgi:hypothetical protein